MACISEQVRATRGFSRLALRYWLKIYPRVVRDMSYWKMRATRIPDPLLRALALDAHSTKRGHVEGAAIFAALLPPARRQRAIRLIVAWQSAYDYIDSVSEQPCADPSTNGRQLHLALLQALKETPTHDDYYAHFSHNQDGNYLADLVHTARNIFITLPHRDLVGGALQRAVTRIVDYQSLNQYDQTPLARWAREPLTTGTPVRWWEFAAASASSLAVLALIATAADPTSTAADTAAIEHAYFPWIGALNTLLDSLVDLREDATANRTSLLNYYSSPQEAAERMRLIANQSMQAIHSLPHSEDHALILSGMASFYLSSPTTSRPTARPMAESVERALSPTADPWLLMHRARREAKSLKHLLRGTHTRPDLPPCTAVAVTSPQPIKWPHPSALHLGGHDAPSVSVTPPEPMGSATVGVTSSLAGTVSDSPASLTR